MFERDDIGTVSVFDAKGEELRYVLTDIEEISHGDYASLVRSKKEEFGYLVLLGWEDLGDYSFTVPVKIRRVNRYENK